jgi:TRAP-type C4-dicarboxylate transport system permease small subunit
MALNKMIAIGFVCVGTLALVYGGFSYTRDTHEAEIGTLSVSLDERQYVAVPIWAGIAAIVIGAALLVLPGKN